MFPCGGYRSSMGIMRSTIEDNPQRSTQFVVSAIVYRDDREDNVRLKPPYQLATLLMNLHLTKCTELFVV